MPSQLERECRVHSAVSDCCECGSHASFLWLTQRAGGCPLASTRHHLSGCPQPELNTGMERCLRRSHPPWRPQSDSVHSSPCMPCGPACCVVCLPVMPPHAALQGWSSCVFASAGVSAHHVLQPVRSLDVEVVRKVLYHPGCNQVDCPPPHHHHHQYSHFVFAAPCRCER